MEADAMPTPSVELLDELESTLVRTFGHLMAPGEAEAIAVLFVDAVAGLGGRDALSRDALCTCLREAMAEGAHPEPGNDDVGAPYVVSLLSQVGGWFERVGWLQAPVPLTEEQVRANDQEVADSLVGQPCLALLDEDQEWHTAKVTQALDAGARFKVLFDEYGKVQIVSRANIAFEDELADNDDDPTAECPMCGRVMPLTAHHLRPRCMHEMYRKRYGFEQKVLNQCTMICRPCHSAVHRTEPNEVLAESYYTLDSLLAHPKLQKWMAYAAKQRIITASDAAIQLRRRK